MPIPVQILSQPVRTVLPLRSLTKDDSVFLWSESHETAFNSAKRLIASTTALRYYDPHFPVTLQVDSSNYAIGRVLLQEGHPVCFTSHTLSNIERNYAQIEKECLAIVSCMDKWHYYLHGKHDTETTNPTKQSLRNPWADPPADCKEWCWGCRNISSLFVIRKGKSFL